MPEAVDLLQTFRFKVSLVRQNPDASLGSGPLGDGYFSECTGLQLEADIKEYLEGGRNDGVVRRVGRVKLVPIVLKRGMFVRPGSPRVDSALWDWLTGMVSGRLPVPRYNGDVEVQDASGRNVWALWTFDNALPLKVVGPSLNAKTGEIAVEELHIAHEGLRLGNRPEGRP